MNANLSSEQLEQEMKQLRFIDLFAGMGGFHRALVGLGHRCVFASEIDDELRELYLQNFPNMAGKVFGDIRLAKQSVPDHDILCAGFPCQPFSKSGAQLGTKDETRGTLFHEILEILEVKKPTYLILENVGNFERHDKGRTWEIVRKRLVDLGYRVRGTEHVTPLPSHDWRDVGASKKRNPTKQSNARSGGAGLLSPHHFGEPHHRERFFIVGTRDSKSPLLLPLRGASETTLASIVQSDDELTPQDKLETKLTRQQFECIEMWGQLVSKLPRQIEFPAAPIWGDELLFPYPFLTRTPIYSTTRALRNAIGQPWSRRPRHQILALLPKYALEDAPTFRQWKINYILRNREWWEKARRFTSKKWRRQLSSFPPSLRKLEWNAKDGERDIWRYVLQFRPSGLRAKRYSSSPALVAMTATQIPILGPERRFLTRVEGLRLLGFPDEHKLPESRTKAFKALGNGVHVAVATAVARCLLDPKEFAHTEERTGTSVQKIKGNRNAERAA